MNVTCMSVLFKLLMSLAAVLRVQDQASWSNTSTQRVYSGLLTFISHKKPKVKYSVERGDNQQ